MVVGTMRARVAVVVMTASFSDRIRASEKPVWCTTSPKLAIPAKRRAA
jgi:hypothetical protein